MTELEGEPPLDDLWLGPADEIVPKERQFMKESTKDKAKGKFHELKGKVKEKVGRATRNPNLEGEGQGEKIGGKVQEKIAEVEKVFGT
jgi:uncharacterized protein YjbJ (UPF0337 family)